MKGLAEIQRDEQAARERAALYDRLVGIRNNLAHAIPGWQTKLDAANNDLKAITKVASMTDPIPPTLGTSGRGPVGSGYNLRALIDGLLEEARLHVLRIAQETAEELAKGKALLKKTEAELATFD